MNAITIDTHEFVKRLRETGLTEPQAEAITDLQRKASEVAFEQAKHDFHAGLHARHPSGDYAVQTGVVPVCRLDEVATRHDVKELELKIEVLRAEVKKDMAETKADLIRWVVGVGILQITIITALLLKLASHL